MWHRHQSSPYRVLRLPAFGGANCEALYAFYNYFGLARSAVVFAMVPYEGITLAMVLQLLPTSRLQYLHNDVRELYWTSYVNKPS